MAIANPHTRSIKASSQIGCDLACAQVRRLMAPIFQASKPQSLRELHELLIKHSSCADEVAKFATALPEAAYTAAATEIHHVLAQPSSPYSFEVQAPDGTISHSTWRAANVLFLHAIGKFKGLNREQRDMFLDRLLNNRAKSSGDIGKPTALPTVDAAAGRIRQEIHADLRSVERFFNHMLDSFQGHNALASRSRRNP